MTTQNEWLEQHQGWPAESQAAPMAYFCFQCGNAEPANFDVRYEELQGGSREVMTCLSCGDKETVYDGDHY